MTAPTVVSAQLAADLALALTRLREARLNGDLDLEWVAERWLDRLLDRILRGKAAGGA